MFLFQTTHADKPLQQQSTEHAALSLFNNLTKYLKSYYSNASIDSRLDRFLNWFDTNRPKLIAQFLQDLHNGKIGVSLHSNFDIQLVIGFWLGTRYTTELGSQFTDTKTARFPRIVPFVESTNSYGIPTRSVKSSNIEACFNTDKFELKTFDYLDTSTLRQLNNLQYPAILLVGFNIGLHEATHGLPFIFGMGKDMLSELATSYMQNHYGFPIRNADLITIFGHYSGARYFAHNFQSGIRRNLLNIEAHRSEYIEFILSQYLVSHAGKKFNLFDFKKGSNYLHIYSEFVTGNLGQLMNQAFTNREATLGKSSVKITPLSEIASEYCKSLSITDKPTIEKVTGIFQWVDSYFMRNPEFNPNDLNLTISPIPLSGKTINQRVQVARIGFAKFISELLQELDKTFGPPEKLNIPEGYAYFNLNNITPKRIS